MKNEAVTFPIYVAGQIADILYKHMYISQDSGHYLFDVLADALSAHPDLAISIASELDTTFDKEENKND